MNIEKPDRSELPQWDYGQVLGNGLVPRWSTDVLPGKKTTLVVYALSTSCMSLKIIELHDELLVF